MNDNDNGNDNDNDTTTITTITTILTPPQPPNTTPHHVTPPHTTNTNTTQSWYMDKTHVFKIECRALQGFDDRVRQYDLIIDGQSFFDMPKVFELGSSAAALSSPRAGAGSGSGFHNHGQGHGHGQGQGHSASSGGTPRPYPSGNVGMVRRSTGGSDRASHFGGAGSSSSSSHPPGLPAYGSHRPRSVAEEEAELQAAIKASLGESQRHLANGSNRSSSSSSSSSNGRPPMQPTAAAPYRLRRSPSRSST